MNKKNMHLIINTHWDREYRWSFPETQLRLGEAVDDLIDIMNRDKNFTYFHTDSQVSMMDDYIDIRPERAEELKKLIKEGRILTGVYSSGGISRKRGGSDEKSAAGAQDSR